MKKRTIALALGALCMVSAAAGAAATGIVQQIQAELRGDFTIVIDGQTRTFKNVNGDTVYPLLYEGTTYLPVRAIGELMGKTVYWFEDEKRVELRDETSTVTDADVIINGGNASSGGGGGAAVNPAPADGGITVEDAKRIAAEKAGFTVDEVQFKRTELDRDDGVVHYEVEFWKDNTEYSADIRVSDGAILSWDIDVEGSAPPAVSGEGITADDAKRIAAEKAGFTVDEVRFDRTELDRDDGVLRYEVEFWKDGVEYSADIRVSDGVILEWDVDRDD